MTDDLFAGVSNFGPSYMPRILMHGEDGVGKSLFWSKTKDPIFLCTEDGADEIDVPKFPFCTRWEQLMKYVKGLAARPKQYKALVVDTIDFAQDLLQAYVLQETFGGRRSAFDNYGEGWAEIRLQWGVLLAALDRVRAAGLTVALIAHTIKERIEDPRVGTYDQYEPNLRATGATNLRAKTINWCDIVVYACYANQVHEIDGRQVEVVVKEDGTEEKAAGRAKREILANKGRGYKAKTRAGWALPDRMPLEPSELRAALASSPAMTRRKKSAVES